MTNPALEEALASFDTIEKTYVAALQKKGLVFAERGSHEERAAQLHAQLKERGAQFRNAGASIRTGWLSKACVECTGMNGSETFSTTFKCHRDCYFCFNYNLGDYEKYVREGCPWEEELQAAYEASGGKMAVLGLTGGEPLLNLEDSLHFLQRAGELFPQAHKRMYTSGDLLTEDGAQRLAQAGLTEMRFSIKQDDPADRRETVLAKMKMATAYIPDVVVEMPIIPGTKDSMKEWMLRFEENGIKGMNLLDTYSGIIMPVLVSTWNLIVMRTSFAGIPDSLEESAHLDGANDWTILWRIFFPLAQATIAVIALFYAVGWWNNWFNPSIFLSSKSKYPLQLVLREILLKNDTSAMTQVGAVGQSQQEQYRMLVKYCTIIVATVPILVVYPFLQRYFVKGVMVGSIKG